METKPIVKLDRATVRAEIEAGDTCEGHRVLAVAPDGSKHKLSWAARNRQWDPWPDGWLTIQIPALDPDGSGEESEAAEDMLRAILSPEAFDKACEDREAADIGWVEFVEKIAPEDWKVNRRDALDWLLDEFLAACNGQGSGLNMLAPWGYQATPYPDELIDNDPPAEFEWA